MIFLFSGSSLRCAFFLFFCQVFNLCELYSKSRSTRSTARRKENVKVNLGDCFESGSLSRLTGIPMFVSTISFLYDLGVFSDARTFRTSILWYFFLKNRARSTPFLESSFLAGRQIVPRNAVLASVRRRLPVAVHIILFFMGRTVTLVAYGRFCLKFANKCKLSIGRGCRSCNALGVKLRS
jgi:hypothetical protein